MCSQFARYHVLTLYSSKIPWKNTERMALFEAKTFPFTAITKNISLIWRQSEKLRLARFMDLYSDKKWDNWQRKGCTYNLSSEI